MLGKTNATTGGSSGGAGDTVTAINKTGAVINEGDKVWLQKDAQTAGTNFTFGSNDSMSMVYYGGYIDRTGNWAWTANKIYDVSGEKAIQSGETTLFSASKGSNNTIKYGPNNSIFISRESSINSITSHSRCDSNKIYDMSNNWYYCGENVRVSGHATSLNLAFFDIETGSTITSITQGSVSSFTNGLSDCVAVFLDNGEKYLFNYTTGSSGQLGYRYIDEANSTFGDYKLWTRKEPTTSTVKLLSVTSDKKYLIASANGYLRLIKISKIQPDRVSVSYYNETSFPDDLKPYYGTVSGSILFNPYTGILTIAARNPKQHLIARYTPEKGFEKLPIDLGSYAFNSPITVSDDLTRACFGEYNKAPVRIVNITTTSGYAVIPYKGYNINSTTLTGKAKTSAEIGAEVEVSTVLPNEVDVTVTASEDDVTLSME